MIEIELQLEATRDNVVATWTSCMLAKLPLEKVFFFCQCNKFNSLFAFVHASLSIRTIFYTRLSICHFLFSIFYLPFAICHLPFTWPEKVIREMQFAPEQRTCDKSLEWQVLKGERWEGEEVSGERGEGSVVLAKQLSNSWAKSVRCQLSVAFWSCAQFNWSNQINDNFTKFVIFMQI